MPGKEKKFRTLLIAVLVLAAAGIWTAGKALLPRLRRREAAAPEGERRKTLAVRRAVLCTCSRRAGAAAPTQKSGRESGAL